MMISIIVPVYNVHEYLEECVHSIVAQTYRDIEIILVDDGSTDGSGEQCDVLKELDKRIMVIHKQNGGLSSARNAGLDVASGEFIGFVDSDDVIREDMYENLIKGFDDSNIGIVACSCLAYDGTDVSTYNEKWTINEPFIIQAEDFAYQNITESVCEMVWSKLFRRELFDKVRFREGINSEDIMLEFDIQKVLVEKHLSSKVIPGAFYLYRIRDGSISQSKITPLCIDIMKNYLTMLNESNDERLCSYLRRIYIGNIYNFMEAMLDNEIWRKKFYDTHRIQARVVRFRDLYIVYQDKPSFIISFYLHCYLPEVRFLIHKIKLRR